MKKKIASYSLTGRRIYTTIVALVLIISVWLGTGFLMNSNAEMTVDSFDIDKFKANLFFDEGDNPTIDDESINGIKDTYKGVVQKHFDDNPTRRFVEELEGDNVINNAILIWKGLDAAANMDVAAGFKMECTFEDYYSAVILKVLETTKNMDGDSTYDPMKGILGKDAKSYYQVAKNLKTINEQYYNLQLDALLESNRNGTISGADKEKLAGLFGKVLNYNTSVKETLNFATQSVDLVLKYAKTVKDIEKYCTNYINAINATNEMFEVLKAMRDNTNSSILKTVLNKYIQAQNNTVSATINFLGDSAITAGTVAYDMLWGQAIKNLVDLLPPTAQALVKAFQVGEKTGKAICDICFSTSSIQEQYFKLKIITATEDALKNAVDSLGKRYLNKKSSENARAHNVAVDMYFNLHVLEGDYVKEMADYIYLRQITNAFGGNQEAYYQLINNVAGYENEVKTFFTKMNTEWLDTFLKLAYPQIYNNSQGYNEYVLGHVVSTGKCGSSINYSLDSEGNLLISGNGAMDNYSDEAASPFSGWNENELMIKTVSIGEGITSIGDNAFNASTAIETVLLPSSLERIGASAFSGCRNLKKINIPDSLNHIGEYAFNWCASLQSVELPDGVEVINKGAFQACNSVMSVELPASLRSIEDNAFLNCSSINNVYFKGSADAWKKVSIGDGNDRVIKSKFHSKDDQYITLEPAELQLEKGKSQKLTVRYWPELKKGDGLVWYSEDEKIAVANSDGTIEAGEEGKTVVHVLHPATGLVANCSITVGGVTHDYSLPIQWGKETYSFINAGDYFYGAQYSKDKNKSKYKYVLDEDLIDGKGLSNTEIGKIKALSRKNWNGSCFGMTTLYHAYYTKTEQLKTLSDANEYTCLHDLPAPFSNQNLHYAINYYQGMQYRDSYLTAKKKFMSKPVEEQLRELVTMVRDVKNTNIPVLIVYDECTRSGYFLSEHAGHAILAYGLEEEGEGDYYTINNKQYKYRVKIIDPNRFNDSSESIDIYNSKKNQTFTFRRADLDIYISEDFKDAVMPFFAFGEGDTLLSAQFVSRKSFFEKIATTDEVGDCVLSLVTNDKNIISNEESVLSKKDWDFNMIIATDPKLIVNGTQMNDLSSSFDGLINKSFSAMDATTNGQLELYVKPEIPIEISSTTNDQTVLVENEGMLVITDFGDAKSDLTVLNNQIELENEKDDFSINIITNQKLPNLNDSAIRISGSGKKKVSLAINKDEVILEGENLAGTTISNSRGEDVVVAGTHKRVKLNYNNHLSYSEENAVVEPAPDISHEPQKNQPKSETVDKTNRITFEERDSLLSEALEGIIVASDGKWALYKNGKIDTSYIGIAQNKYGWWRIKNGYVDFSANGIYQNEYGWWKTTNGKVTFDETGVFQNENGWWRVENSKVNFQANSIYQNEYGWWKTTNGKVTFDETGIFQNENGWWRVENSKVNFHANSIYQNPYGWWKTSKGKVTFKETGIFKNEYGRWYVKDSKVDFSARGRLKINGKAYEVKNGKVAIR